MDEGWQWAVAISIHCSVLSSRPRLRAVQCITMSQQMIHRMYCDIQDKYMASGDRRETVRSRCFGHGRGQEEARRPTFARPGQTSAPPAQKMCESSHRCRAPGTGKPLNKPDTHPMKSCQSYQVVFASRDENVTT